MATYYLWWEQTIPRKDKQGRHYGEILAPVHGRRVYTEEELPALQETVKRLDAKWRHTRAVAAVEGSIRHWCAPVPPPVKKKAPEATQEAEGDTHAPLDN